jgi:hypothetical protein
MRRTSISPASERLRFRPIERVCLVVGAGGLLIAFLLVLWRGPLPFEGLIQRFAQMDKWADGARLASQPALLRKYYGLTLAVGFSLAGLTTLLALAWSRQDGLTQAMVWRATCTLACTCALSLYIFRITTDGPWAPVDVLMSNPSALPIFGHRLLFVWLAKAFHAAVPMLSPLRCFYASQVVAALLTIYAVGRWSTQHVGEALSSLGQVLAVILISTCLGYRNFYDIGIVFFFSCGLLALYRRKYVWFVVVVAVGTLNHENALLLVPTAAFLLYDAEPRRVWVPLVAASLTGHLLARAALQWLIPFQTHVDWGIWSNMTKPFLLSRDMAYSLLALGGWYALGLMSLPACDKRLRRLLLLFPMLFGVTFLFGQFHEPRQFNAFIPVLIAVLLSALRRMADPEQGAVRRS